MYVSCLPYQNDCSPDFPKYPTLKALGTDCGGTCDLLLSPSQKDPAKNLTPPPPLEPMFPGVHASISTQVIAAHHTYIILYI